MFVCLKKIKKLANIKCFILNWNNLYKINIFLSFSIFLEVTFSDSFTRIPKVYENGRKEVPRPRSRSVFTSSHNSDDLQIRGDIVRYEGQNSRPPFVPKPITVKNYFSEDYTVSKAICWPLTANGIQKQVKSEFKNYYSNGFGTTLNYFQIIGSKMKNIPNYSKDFNYSTSGDGIDVLLK